MKTDSENKATLHEHSHNDAHSHSHSASDTHGHSTADTHGHSTADTHGHNHVHGHSHHHHGDAEGNISAAFFLNAFFVVVEVVGGILTNSIAILSDALHDFGDCISLAIAWALQKKSKQGRDEKYTYGYKRFSLLGSLFLSGILTVSSLFILVEAVRRILDPQVINAQGMIWIAILGVIINGSAALKVKKGTSLNERAVFLHIMEDTLGWVAVLAASIIMHFVNIPVLDPILSIAIGLWVLYNVIGNLRAVFRVMLQGTPEDIDLDELKEDLTAIQGVESVHDLHIWSMDGETNVMTVHVVTDPQLISDMAAATGLKKKIADMLEEFHVGHVTIEIEPEGTECVTGCECHND